MKKTVIILVSAFVACVSCIKENNGPAAQEGTTIIATTEATKATVDGLQVQWTTGDQVALFIEDGTTEPFTLVGEGPVVKGKFSTSAYTPSTGHMPVGLAAFPAEGATRSGSKVSVKVPAEIPYGTSPVPMIGTTTDGTTFNFAIATGAIRISYKNLPPYPFTFVLQADKPVAGTLEIADYTKPTGAAFVSEGASNTITVTGMPQEGDAEITIPLPAGDYNFGVALLAADGTTPVPRSNKGSTAAPAKVTIEAGKITRMKPIDLEEGTPASRTLTTAGAQFNPATLPGKWNVLGNNSSKDGIKVLGGGGGSGYPAFVCPYDKTWCWDDSCYRESDNELIIKVGSISGTTVSGTMNWWAGADGQFWNYTWKYKNSNYPQYDPFYGTDLSVNYNKIPKGEKAFTLDLTTMKVTLANGETPEVLTPGTYTYVDSRTLTIPDGCFALQFHLGNMKPYSTTWGTKDIDRFMFCPLEYVIIFERTGDL